MAKCSPGTGLTTRQLEAVTLLAIGNATTVVARRVGVDRRTVYRWRADNPHFIAELGRRQHEAYSLLTDRVRRVALRAMRVIDRELTRKRSSLERSAAPLALGVLRATGALRAIEPTSPQTVEAVVDRQVRESRGTNRNGEEQTEQERSAILDAWRVNPEGIPGATGPSGFHRDGGRCD